MRVIKNQDDVRLLKEAKAISPQLAEHLIQFLMTCRLISKTCHQIPIG